MLMIAAGVDINGCALWSASIWTAHEGRGFAVVGYGKLGGWELGYEVPVDLIFLHDCRWTS